MNVFEEDHLVPIARIGGALAFFDTLHGRIALLGDSGYRSISLQGMASPWCVPGEPVVLDLEQNAATLWIRRHRITAAAIVDDGESCFDAPPADAFRPSAVLADPGGGTVVAFSGAADEVALLHTRTRTVTRVPAPGTPRAILDPGALLSETPGGWSVRTAGGATHSGPGRIVSVGTSSALARESRRHGPDVVRMVGATGSRILPPPAGWTLLSAVASDARTLAVGLHPELGYRLLRGAELQPQPNAHPATQLYPLGARDGPVQRSTGVASGSSWRIGERTWVGAAAPRPDLTVDTVMHPVPLLRIRGSAGSRRLIVSLHGGPDSHELDDLRYGGLYRELARTADVVAVNYPGSAGLGDDFQRSAWGSWRSALDATAATIARCAQEFGATELRLLGVSFGAWIALQLPASLPAVRSVTAASPILDLTGHLRRHAALDPSLDAWGRQRFGAEFGEAVDGDARLLACAVPVTVLAPDNDEVVDPAATARVVASARAAGRPWRRVEVPGAHYPHTVDHARRRWAAMTDGLRPPSAPG